MHFSADEEEEPPPVPPRGSRRKLTPEPSAGSSMESEAAKRPKTEQPTDTLRQAGSNISKEFLFLQPEKLRKRRKRRQKKWKGLGRLHSCTTGQIETN